MHPHSGNANMFRTLREHVIYWFRRIVDFTCSFINVLYTYIRNICIATYNNATNNNNYTQYNAAGGGGGGGGGGSIATSSNNTHSLVNKSIGKFHVCASKLQ